MRKFASQSPQEIILFVVFISIEKQPILQCSSTSPLLVQYATTFGESIAALRTDTTVDIESERG